MGASQQHEHSDDLSEVLQQLHDEVPLRVYVCVCVCKCVCTRARARV